MSEDYIAKASTDGMRLLLRDQVDHVLPKIEHTSKPKTSTTDTLVMVGLAEGWVPLLKSGFGAM